MMNDEGVAEAMQIAALRKQIREGVELSALGPKPATYIGAGGLVRVEVTPGAHLDSLRQARRFIDGLIEDVQTAPNRST